MGIVAQRQRRLAEKASRRKAVVAGKRMLDAAPAGLASRVRVAGKGEIVRCLVPTTLFQIGIGHVIVARALPSGLIGCAFFLVDVFCLGVKSIFYDEMAAGELRSKLDYMDTETFVEVEPTYARKLIHDSAAYAASLGLSAARDTPVIEAIFGDVDINACTNIFTFGVDGKPLFVNGQTTHRLAFVPSPMPLSTARAKVAGITCSACRKEIRGEAPPDWSQPATA